MNRNEMANYMDNFYNEQITALREAGQSEYARTTDNAFANFERIAAYKGAVTREDVCSVYLLKHLDGIMAWLEGTKDQREDVQERIGDAITYLFLLSAMIEDSRSKD